jgi:hypothetical protein
MSISKYLGWRVRLGILLVLISITLYGVNFVIFHDSRDLFFYLGIDIAFLPIEVLFVVLVIESAISQRDRTILLEKLNMVIGTFFSEVGTHLVKNISEFDSKVKKIRENLIVSDDWSRADFLDASRQIRNYNYRLNIIDSEKSFEFLESMKHFLIDKRNFLLVLLENPSLLEHETFTELLRAVFHLTEELEQRNDLRHLSRADYEHLELDTERAYKLLIYEWLQYMEYLMNEYPYLFSLALRTNPFDPSAKVEIED